MKTIWKYFSGMENYLIMILLLLLGIPIAMIGSTIICWIANMIGG